MLFLWSVTVRHDCRPTTWRASGYRIDYFEHSGLNINADFGVTSAQQFFTEE